jgi:hypothetical protein
MAIHSVPRLVSVFLLTLLFSGCATVDKLGTPENFAKCATFDVATTTIGLATNRMHEIDPLVKALTVHGIGRVGAVVPVIGLSIAGYYFLKWLNKPAVTATAAGLTCLSAGRNLYLIR